MIEQELKLLIELKHHAVLKRASWLKEISTTPLRRQTLQATYFDTPDLDLHQKKIMLRTRKEGRQYIQCLKSPAPISDGIQARKEWETRIPNADLNRDLLSLPPCNEIVAEDQIKKLDIIFNATIIRQKTHLILPDDSIIEIAFDRGKIEAAGQVLNVSEVELELKVGEPQAMFVLARKILDTIPARISTTSKSARGYALLKGSEPTFYKANICNLPADISMGEAFVAIANTCLFQVHANADCVLQDTHIEGVHQMRVAMRRLRSLLSICKPLLAPSVIEINDSLRDFGNRLGVTRDWDVFANEMIPPVIESCKDSMDLSSVLDVARKERDQSLKAIQLAMTDGTFTRMLIDVEHWLTSLAWQVDISEEQAAIWRKPVRDVAVDLLEKRYRKLRKAAKKLATQPPPERHAARILAKKLRYACEFFTCLFENRKTAKTFIKQLSQFQTQLGYLNDAAQANIILTRMSKAHPKLTMHAGIIIGWLQHLADDHLHDQAKTWLELKSATCFWQGSSS